MENSVILFTGHLLDAEDRQSERFPVAHLDEARLAVGEKLDIILKDQKPTLAISSLGAGGDMIFASEVLKRKIPLIVFLPFEKDKFLELSVKYLKGIPNENPREWEREFNQISRQAEKIIIISQNVSEIENAFAECNNAMLEYALERTNDEPDKIIALALVKDLDNKIKGGTSDYVSILEEKNIVVYKV